jgi:hypothetical protein
MKRKVKFQVGGEVPPENPARNRKLRTIMDGFKSLGQRDRAAAQRFIEQFNQQPAVQEANQRTTSAMEARRLPVPAGGGSGPPALPPSSNVPMMPEPGGRGMVPYREPGVPATRPGAGAPSAPGGAMVPRPRPDFSGMMREGLSASGRPPMSGRLPPLATVGRALPLVGGAMAALEPTSLQEGADFERRRLQQARDEALARDRAPMDQELGEAPQRMPTSRPRPRPQARPSQPRESGLTPDILMDLASGRREPANQAERIALINIERRRGEIAAEPYKKGGMVKPKAAPKKMMKGGVVAKPKVAAKKGKPMPAFKKGGPVKKAKGGMIGKGCK